MPLKSAVTERRNLELEYHSESLYPSSGGSVEVTGASARQTCRGPHSIGSIESVQNRQCPRDIQLEHHPITERCRASPALRAVP